MIDLSKAKLNRRIPKNSFDFAMPEVENVYWMYKVSAETTSLNASEVMPELQVFKIDFRGEIDRSLLLKIQSKIPYPILFVTSKKYYIVGNKTVLETSAELLQEDNLNILATSIKSLYNELVKLCIGMPRRDGEPIEAYIQRSAEINKLKKEIEVLKKKMMAEKQPNKKMAINTIIASKISEVTIYER